VRIPASISVPFKRAVTKVPTCLQLQIRMLQMALYSPTKEENESLITFIIPNLINQEASIRYNITYANTDLKYVNSLL